MYLDCNAFYSHPEYPGRRWRIDGVNVRDRRVWVSFATEDGRLHRTEHFHTLADSPRLNFSRIES